MLNRLSPLRTRYTQQRAVPAPAVRSLYRSERGVGVGFGRGVGAAVADGVGEGVAVGVGVGLDVASAVAVGVGAAAAGLGEGETSAITGTDATGDDGSTLVSPIPPRAITYPIDAVRAMTSTTSEATIAVDKVDLPARPGRLSPRWSCHARSADSQGARLSTTSSCWRSDCGTTSRSAAHRLVGSGSPTGPVSPYAPTDRRNGHVCDRRILIDARPLEDCRRRRSGLRTGITRHVLHRRACDDAGRRAGYGRAHARDVEPHRRVRRGIGRRPGGQRGRRGKCRRVVSLVSIWRGHAQAIRRSAATTLIDDGRRRGARVDVRAPTAWARCWRGLAVVGHASSRIGTRLPGAPVRARA